MHAHTTVPTLIDSGPTNEPDRELDANVPSPTEHEPLRLPVSMPVSEARDALVAAGEAIALVTDRGDDVGVVTAAELAGHESRSTTVIGDVMGCEVVRIDPSTDVRWTLRTYREAAWSSVIRRRPGEAPTPFDAPRDAAVGPGHVRAVEWIVGHQDAGTLCSSAVTAEVP